MRESSKTEQKLKRKDTCGIKCSVCGRFCIPVDSSCPFGNYDSLDPPNEEFYCSQCVIKEREYHIAHGWLPVNWRKSKWEYEVATILGYILISLPFAAWSVWHKAVEPIPEGYQVYPNPIKEEKDERKR